MRITVELLFDNTDEFDHVTGINTEGDFIIIDYKRGDRNLQKVYLANQVITINCRV